MQEENPLNYMFLDEEPVNYREKIEKYLAYWKWFLGCAFIALICAKIYLRYTPNQYQVATTILIENEENTGLGSDLSALQNLGLGGNSATLVENEMGILQSRTLMENVVKDLGLNVSYYHEGTIKTNELFGANSPIKINFFSKDSIFYKLDTVFRIAIKSPTKFVLTSGDELQASEHVFGENIVSKIGNFTITPRNIKEDLVDTEVLVRVSPLKSTVQNYKGRLGVDFLTEYSDILKITLNGQIEQKASVILNNLVMHYNKNAIENKSQLAINTNNFIVKRLEVISQDLSDIDKGVQQFKTTNKLTDIPEEASLIVKTNAKLEQEIIDVNTQLKLTAYVTEYLASNSADLIPANVGLSDGAVSANTSKYNQLLLERNRILTSSSNLNPVIINLNNQIKELRASVSQSLVNFTSSLTIKLNSLKQQEAILNSKIIAVPGQERAYRDIERQQQIIEELYLYLLEKREENAISLAATMPNATVIDRADGSGTPISPNSKKIYLIALFLGLAIPFVLIYIRFLLDNKVHTAKEVEDAIKAPFLGELPHTKLEKKLVVSDTERSNEAEAFRMLRTNMNFMLSNVKEKGETIYVTSTIPNEGKTFISVNLASVLSLSDKKVLLIGADLRKPKIAEYLNMRTTKGLTGFLTDRNLKVSDVIEQVPNTNFDVIQSGMMPPNPSELLMNGRIEEILDYGTAHYDYVIADTSPVSLVTDTYELTQKADLILYVVRANFLDKRMLEIPAKLYKGKRFPNMAVVLNDSNLKKGYGYGYYSEEQNNPWWKKVLNS